MAIQFDIQPMKDCDCIACNARRTHIFKAKIMHRAYDAMGGFGGEPLKHIPEETIRQGYLFCEELAKDKNVITFDDAVSKIGNYMTEHMKKAE